MCDPDYRPGDEPEARLELRAFLSGRVAESPPLQFSKKLCAISTSCVLNVGCGRVKHSSDIAQIASTHGANGCVIGEMYWAFAKAPQSADEVLRDLALDIGCADRSHREGLLDPDFVAVGACLSFSPGVGCVTFIHFPSKIPSENAPRRGSRTIASPIVGMKRMFPRISGEVIDLPSSEDEAPNNDAPSSRNQRARRGEKMNRAFRETPDLDMEDKTLSSPRPTFNQRDTHLQMGVTREEHAMEGQPACALKDTPVSEDAILQATTSTGPESEASAPLQQTLSALGGSKPPLSPISHVAVRDSPTQRASYEPPWGGNSFCAGREWGVSQTTAFTSTAEIRYLSSWCTPAAKVRGSVGYTRGGESNDKHPRSPTTIARSVSETLKDLTERGDILWSGIKEESFSQTEWEFVQNNMQMLSLSREENSGFIYPNIFSNKRKALRVLMEDLRGTYVAAPIQRGSIQENHASLWRYVEPMLDTLIAASFLKICRGCDLVEHHENNPDYNYFG